MRQIWIGTLAILLLTPAGAFAGLQDCKATPNPRELLGWHFRNSDNTGPNEGAVNAPQKTRVFVISPGIADFKPSGGTVELDPSDGLGVLQIAD